MYYAANLRERLIQLQMGRCIGGRIVITLYLIALKVDNYHILRLQQIVLYSAGFDYKKTLFPVDSTDISPCIGDKSSSRKLHIGFIYLFFQFL